MFEERARPRRKLPTRTLLLMLLALAAFGRMWWVMSSQDDGPSDSQVIEVVPLPPSPADGG